MKICLFLTLTLLGLLSISACSPAPTEAVPQPSRTIVVEASSTPVIDVPSATLEGSGQPTADSTATPLVEAQPLATSRGPELHATDPTTVSLAAGQLHFVEFFRFT